LGEASDVSGEALKERKIEMKRQFKLIRSVLTIERPGYSWCVNPASKDNDPSSQAWGQALTFKGAYHEAERLARMYTEFDHADMIFRVYDCIFEGTGEELGVWLVPVVFKAGPTRKLKF
jgi:hypothetical protein